MHTETITPTQRKQLETKMQKLFSTEMKKLSRDMQTVLADDIVTAFLNRISIFLKIEAKTKRYTRTKRISNP